MANNRQNLKFFWFFFFFGGGGGVVEIVMQPKANKFAAFYMLL